MATEARKGFKLVPCNGEAHSNPHIDNCMICAPRWGWIEVPDVVSVPVTDLAGAYAGDLIVRLTHVVSDEAIKTRDGFRWNETAGDITNATTYGRWERDTAGTCFVPEMLSGSDYSGGLVHRSNHDAWVRDFADGESVWWADVSGGYGTYAIVIDCERIPRHREADVRDWFDALATYPLADEDLHSELEMRAEGEAWERYVREDFRKALKAAGMPVSKLRSDRRLFDLFCRARDTANVYWEHTAEGPHIDVKRVADAVTREMIDDVSAPREKWVSCPECEAGFNVAPHGGKLPPHPAFRGTGTCPASGRGVR